MSSASTGSSEERLAKLHEIILECGECELALRRAHAVPGEGSAKARVMFIGEAPGAEEDAQGRPFVGPAGQLLNELLEAAGLDRASVFITNVVKCRPPGNAVPTSEQAEACSAFLRHQVRTIGPAVVCTLGGAALKAVLGEAVPMGRVHGSEIRRKHFTLVPLYHPAAALHRPELRDTLFDDMRALGARLEQSP
jgi:uracil-DNA glycosylase